MKVSKIGEFGLIGIIQKMTPQSKGVIKSIGDDTAVVALNDREYQLLTTDMLVQSVHFTRAMSSKAVGYKALACSVSDIASMGGVPKYALVSLGIPRSLGVSFVKELYKGINQCARKFSVDVVGGDITSSQKIIINIALTGVVRKKDLVLRSGAKKGDEIFLTGRVGRSFQSGRHLRFLPRIKEAQFLVKKFKPSSMIDVSDGLLQDLKHLLKRAQLGADLWEEKIPKTKGASLKNSLSDGEDFELLFTVSKEKAKKLLKESSYKFYHIGSIVGSHKGVKLHTKAKKVVKLDSKGYTHF